jgi:hypothetical protein
LRGPVQLSYGSGLAGVVGKAIARRLGIPGAAGNATLEVVIHGDDAGLHWSRRFNDGPAFNSLFRPVGAYPSGHWIERTGPIRLWLKVALVDGGWHWTQTRLCMFGVPLPTWLMPRMIASKAVIDGQYVFTVEMRFPLLGSVLAYRGTLEMCPPSH